MLHFEMNPSAKEWVSLFHALKKDMLSCPMLNQNIEDNKLVAIYDKDGLCGGAVILGSEKPAYLYCFFDNPDYSTEQYHPKLKEAIASVFPGMDLFDVHCLKQKITSDKGAQNGFAGNIGLGNEL